MKIRIYDDSIRLRLDRSEVEQIGQGLAVEGITRFPAGNQFAYRLSVARAASATAVFEDGCINVLVPGAQAEHWAHTEAEVSIHAVDGALKLLIEKDFECLDPREGEDQSNRFVNPKAPRST